ncbi:MFS transporter [Rhodoluna lacicola]|uniref:Major Facilitator Superfamily n=1 Tax=Rhodoluna lacicola TaxID=529884 RepID=A0A060JNI3_9MICO|nr:MFS transporter [Rhodoluna lacicola]AIC47749.1 Major Facilitator Superfamily [Rhodoluna lacicola]
MTSLQKARAAVFVYFLLCGSAVTIWATHIPLVQKTLALSHTQIGFIILLMGAGALASMQVVGAMVDRFGSGRVLVWISVALGLALGLPGLAINYLTLAIAIFILGLNIGGIDIAMNAQALELERAYGRPIFSSFHAMWSIGGVLGSLSAGAALSLKIAMPVTMGTWGLLTIATGLAFSKKLLNVTIDAGAESVAKSKGRPREFYYVLFIGLVSASAAIIEGIGIDWSALFTIEKFNSSVAVGGISIATFTAAMAIVRFIADKVVARYGRIFVIRNGALVASVGIALSILTPNLPLSWIGWAIAGIGISAVVPQCMAFASDIGSLQNQGRNLAKVVGLTYAGVLGGPAVIGFIGNAIGLQGALVSGILLALFIAIGSILMQKGKAKYGKTI